MADNRQTRPSSEDVNRMLAQLKRETPRQECRSCECLQGFIAQLSLDTGDETLLAEYEVDPSCVHGGLSCDLCPPADLFAQYLMHKRKA